MRQYLALMLCFAAAAPVTAATVTINSSNVVTVAYSGSSSDFDADSSTAYGSRTVTSAVGGSSSTTYIDWQNTGSGAVFNFDFAQVRTGVGQAYAYASGNSLIFTVDQATTYSLSGLYAMSGSANLTISNVILEDLTTPTTLFWDFSYSINTANENFILGAVGDGDYNNTNLGSPTGSLLSGHVYRLYFENYIQAFARTDSGATATGCLTFSVGGATSAGDCGAAPAPVPLPAAAWLLLSGLGGLGLLRKRKAA